MNRLSLFKIQSLVAMVLCTSITAYGASTFAEGGKEEDESSTREERPSTQAQSASQESKIRKLCGMMRTSSSDCEKTFTDVISSAGGSDVASQKCEQAQTRDTQKQQEANDAQQEYFRVMNEKLEAFVQSEQVKIKSGTEVSNAQLSYDTAIKAINLTLPNTTQQIRDQAAKELSKLKAQMIEIGKQVIEADNILRQAQTAIDDAASNMQATCATFAGSKANKKLDDIDKQNAAIKGAQNTYVNYNSTNVAGAKNRRNEKRARQAQLAYMSAYAACMAGETDKNGGEVGPGPQLAMELKKAQQALPKAQDIHKQTMQLIEMQKQTLMEQMAQSEQSMDTAIKTAMLKAQLDSNAAYTQLQQTINNANAEVAGQTLGYNLKSAKGGLWDQQQAAATYRGQQATQAALVAANTASQFCDKQMGANPMQRQQRQQEQLTNTLRRATGIK